ncbi:mCG1047184 [Mus musculus]|nr:mCG1047184 [Mus musculus]
MSYTVGSWKIKGNSCLIWCSARPKFLSCPQKAGEVRSSLKSLLGPFQPQQLHCLTSPNFGGDGSIPDILITAHQNS